MKARTRNALGALVLLALAAGALAWAGIAVDRREERERADRERREKVFGFAAREVRALRIVAKGEAVRLERAGEGWRLVEPLAADADAFAAEAVAEKLATLRRKREAAPAPGGDLDRFGLASPRATVEATLADGRTETLALGDDSSFDPAVFVRPTSGEVVAVGTDARLALERTAFDLREKRVAPFARDRVASIRLEGGWALRRAADGTWAFDPPGAPVDPAKVAALLGALETLRAVRFHDRGAVVAPARAVILAAADGAELARLDVGAVAGDEVLVRSSRTPGVAAVPKAAVEAIFVPAKALEPSPPAPAAPAPAEPPAPAPAAAPTTLPKRG